MLSRRHFSIKIAIALAVLTARVMRGTVCEHSEYTPVLLEETTAQSEGTRPPSLSQNLNLGLPSHGTYFIKALKLNVPCAY